MCALVLHFLTPLNLKINCPVNTHSPYLPPGDQTLATESGEVTSHLSGMFYRTSRMLEAGAHVAGSSNMLL